MNPFTKFPILKWVAIAIGGLAVAAGAFFGIKALLSSEGELDLGMIPDDVDYVASFNVQKALDQTGIKITDDGIELPDELSDYESLIDDDVMDIIVRCNKAIESRQIMFFGFIKPESLSNSRDIPNDVYALAKVKDNGLLRELLEDEADLTRDEDEGFDIYTKGKKPLAILVKDGYMWFVGGATDSKAVKKVQKLLDRADEKSLKDMKGIAQNINNGSIFTLNVNTGKILKLSEMLSGEMPTEYALALSAVSDKLKGSWFNFSADLEGTTATLKGKYYKPDDGKTVDFGVSQPVDTHFLTYIPADFQCVAAFEIKPEITAQLCDGLLKFTDNLYEQRISNAMEYSYYYDDYYIQSIRDEQQMVRQYINALRDIDGTIGGGIGFSDLPELIYGGKTGGLRFVFTAQMKPGTADNLKNSLRSAFNPIDSTAVTSDDIVIPVTRDMSLYIKSIGNDIILSNFDVRQGNTNNFASAVQGNDMVLSAKIPTVKDLTDSQCDYGFNAEYKYVNGECSFIVEITNCKENIIGAIMNLTKGFIAGENSYDRTHNDYSYGYDSGYGYDTNAIEAVADSTVAYEYAY